MVRKLLRVGPRMGCGEPQHTLPPSSGRLDLGARDSCLLMKVSYSLKAAVGKDHALSCSGNPDGPRKATCPLWTLSSASYTRSHTTGAQPRQALLLPPSLPLRKNPVSPHSH